MNAEPPISTLSPAEIKFRDDIAELLEKHKDSLDGEGATLVLARFCLSFVAASPEPFYYFDEWTGAMRAALPRIINELHELERGVAH